jgi:hypothetical protein
VAPKRIRAGWVAAVTVHSAAIVIPAVRLLRRAMEGVEAIAVCAFRPYLRGVCAA